VVAILGPFTWETMKAYAWFMEKIPEGYEWPRFTDMWFTVAVAITCFYLEKLFIWALYPWYYQICKEKKDERLRDIRTRKAISNIFRTVYYSVSSFAGWYALKDSFHLPPSLGGSGDLHNSLKDFPYPELPQYYRLYFTGAMGYHLASMVTLAVSKEKKNDYVEMMLHHLVTMYLCGFSYLTNTLIGGIIAYLHDIADIFVSLTRAVSESEWKATTAGLFTFTLIVWFHTRLWVFPQCIYIVTYKL